jgi:hypothetical protein
MLSNKEVQNSGKISMLFFDISKATNGDSIQDSFL